MTSTLAQQAKTLLEQQERDRRDYIEAEIQGVADRLFGGDRAALAAWLSEG